jgi:hypothetical protein
LCPELGIIAISGVGQHHTCGHTAFFCPLYLGQRNLGLRLKCDLFGNPGFLPSF